ncbi:SH3 domain-containing protein [Flavobacterium tegetincola]|uniref:SH3 domain-containing protein n=1 Tax=Flavobacterium tegetincola TaxID=150172 RepID=UPI000413E897|nr:SH3 domain-containing protein [Flavobacterium tegetincola]
MKKYFTLLLFLLSIFLTASAQPAEQYTVASTTATLRSGQGKEFDIVATLSKNEIVRVLKVNDNGWWHVDYNGKDGFIVSQFLKKRSNEGWIPTQYESGDTPQCDNVKPEYDLKLDNHLKVTVNSKTDVVLKLMRSEKAGDVCIRTVYIESNDFLLIKNIPEGKYYLKLAYGTDWRQKNINGKCQGRFTENARYEIGEERLNYKIVQFSTKVDIPSYSLSLGMKAREGIEATFNSNQISEVEFNK